MTESVPEAGLSGPLVPGSVIGGRYRIGNALGDGASGVVYRAECVEARATGESASVLVGQIVALKVIHRHLARDHQISRRFHREARILRQLRGPNLVPLLDFGEAEDGLLYMALEHVQGTPLDVLVKTSSFDAVRATEIVRQICCALDAAHAQGVVHRDLKPGNVVIERDEEDQLETARVLDFGLAKVLRGDASQSLTALTQQNMVFGTPEYMAPEAARGDDVDFRSDIYAAGIILYELLTGSVPFAGKNPISVMTAHLTDAVVPPSERAPHAGITPALDAVVMHALAKKPDDRYPSASALATVLATAQKRPRDVASTAPPPLELDLGNRDTELSVGTPAATEVVPKEAELPRTRSSGLFWLIAVVAALLGIAAGVVLSLAGS
ncbi:MAG: serine/threonine protein kinase [Myxococcales bacterium]|nr:serine/threonine protein kinase [Myxococcales bacterium]